MITKQTSSWFYWLSWLQAFVSGHIDTRKSMSLCTLLTEYIWVSAVYIIEEVTVTTVQPPADLPGLAEATEEVFRGVELQVAGKKEAPRVPPGSPLKACLH